MSAVARGAAGAQRTPPVASPSATSASVLPEAIEAALRRLVRDSVREVLREELTAVLVREPLIPSPPPKVEHTSQYMDARAAGEVLGVTEKTIRSWVREGKLHGHWAGRLLRIERSELHQFMRTGLPSGPTASIEKLADAAMRRRR